MYPSNFEALNLPAVVKWAKDKMVHHHKEADKEVPATGDHWHFHGYFPHSPKPFYAMTTDPDGTEWHAIVSVQSPKYRGQKPFVAIELSRYVPA